MDILDGDKLLMLLQIVRFLEQETTDFHGVKMMWPLAYVQDLVLRHVQQTLKVVQTLQHVTTMLLLRFNPLVMVS